MYEQGLFLLLLEYKFGLNDTTVCFSSSSHLQGGGVPYLWECGRASPPPGRRLPSWSTRGAWTWAHCDEVRQHWEGFAVPWAWHKNASCLFKFRKISWKSSNSQNPNIRTRKIEQMCQTRLWSTKWRLLRTVDVHGWADYGLISWSQLKINRLMWKISLNHLTLLSHHELTSVRKRYCHNTQKLPWQQLVCSKSEQLLDVSVGEDVWLMTLYSSTYLYMTSWASAVAGVSLNLSFTSSSPTNKPRPLQDNV